MGGDEEQGDVVYRAVRNDPPIEDDFRSQAEEGGTHQREFKTAEERRAWNDGVSTFPRGLCMDIARQIKRQFVAELSVRALFDAGAEVGPPNARGHRTVYAEKAAMVAAFTGAIVNVQGED